MSSKNFLFISNNPKATKEIYYSKAPKKIGDFAKSAIISAQTLGYKVYQGINRKYASEIKNDMEVTFYNAEIYRNPYNWKEVRKAYKNLCNLLSEVPIDVIHCSTPIGGVIGRIAGKKYKVRKVIYQVHGFHFYKGAPIKNWLVYYPIEKYFARYCDTIITINQEDYQMAQTFKLRNDGKVYYIPGVGVNTKEYQIGDVDKNGLKECLGLKDEDIILIAMGDLIHRKNYSVSIKSIAKANNPKLHFLICGKGPELASLEKLANKLGVEKQIHFLGFRTDIKQLLTISDIFLFTTYQEGLPRSMMEAMSAGLPCIVSKIRGNVDLIEEGVGGYLRKPDDVDGLAKAINLLANDKDLRKKMSHNNIETIKQFDIENVKNKMKKIYEEVLGEI